MVQRQPYSEYMAWESILYWRLHKPVERSFFIEPSEFNRNGT